LQEQLAELNRQLHAAQSELLRTRSLAMIAQMAAGAAHELNNPLAVISGRVQMLARNATDEGDRRALEIVWEQCDRATMIVTELMAFAKPDPPQQDALPVGPWLHAFRERWLERSTLDPEEFSLEISDPHITLRVDPRQVGAILDAVLTNAIEAMAGTSARLVINSTAPTSDDTVVLSVRDNGKGMPPEVLEHALDPFFSYRAAGRGRGLGLSRAARLAEINGGRLWLESTEGRGTNVFVELPTCEPT
jgi:signal transduction histidine kinase